MNYETLPIDLGETAYPVFIGEGLLVGLKGILEPIVGGSDFFVIIDENIQELYGDAIACGIGVARDDFFVIKAGKDNKTFSAAMSIFSELDKKNISRDSTIIAVGGGVVGDLAGFVASCWYRGTGLVHMPTSLLAAVDSTLGGKTAINFKKTVNAVGSYHHPKAIVIDTDLLMSLPTREISSGFGEIIKYAVIGNSEIKDKLTSLGDMTSFDLSWYISNSLKTKEKFVSNDVQEGSKRLFLNFGHTIGHAIEFSTIVNGKELLRHGEGVALGMLAVFYISKHLGYLNASDIDWLMSSLTAYNLPTSLQASMLAVSRESLVDRIIDLAFKDKKRIKKTLRLILLDNIGNPFIFESDDRELVRVGVEAVVV